MSRTSLGVTVFLVWVTAFLSSSYALYTVLDGHSWGAFAALALGLLSSCTLMVFYRELVGSQSKRAVLIRVPLAIVACFVVAAPLEMMFLEGSIDSELHVLSLKEQDTASSRRKEKLDELERRREELQNSVSRYMAEVLNWESVVEAETIGRQVAGRTGVAGAGPAYREAVVKRDSSAAMLSYHEKELKRYEEFEAEERVRIDDDYKQMSARPPRGFLARFEALDRLKSTSAAATAVSWGAWVFFMFIGLLPILVKFLLPYNEYDALVEARRRSTIQLIHELSNERMGELTKTIRMPIGAEKSVVDV